jgi:hypothetical protein
VISKKQPSEDDQLTVAESAERRFIQQNAARFTNGRFDWLRRSIALTGEGQVWAASADGACPSACAAIEWW